MGLAAANVLNCKLDDTTKLLEGEVPLKGCVVITLNQDPPVESIVTTLDPDIINGHVKVNAMLDPGPLLL
jgi:hypothetical protein